MCTLPRSKLEVVEMRFLICEAVFIKSFSKYISLFRMNGTDTLLSKIEFGIKKDCGICLKIVFLCRSDGCRMEVHACFTVPTHSRWPRTVLCPSPLSQTPGLP